MAKQIHQARINVDLRFFTDDRLDYLSALIGDRYIAMGACLELWKIAQRHWISTKDIYIPKDWFLRLKYHKEFIETDLARYTIDPTTGISVVYVCGIKDFSEWITKRSKAGKKITDKKSKASRENLKKARDIKALNDKNGIEKLTIKDTITSLSQNTSSHYHEHYHPHYDIALDIAPSLPLAPDLVPGMDLDPSLALDQERTMKKEILSGEVEKSTITGTSQNSISPSLIKETAKAVWKNYSDAYHNRYGAYPVRNAQVNSMILSFCKKLELKEAPYVAEFFLSHNDYWYVKHLHPVNILLKDAEKLRTEWKTGVKTTEKEARLSDKEQQFESQLARIERGEL